MRRLFDIGSVSLYQKIDIQGHIKTVKQINTMDDLPYEYIIYTLFRKIRHIALYNQETSGKTTKHI